MIPNTLILDTAQFMEDFYCTTAYMKTEDFQPGQILGGIVECIGVETEAEFELAQSAYELQTTYMLGERDRDGEIIATASNELGLRIFKKLQSMGVYSRGFLGYTLRMFDDETIILQQPKDWRQYE